MHGLPPGFDASFFLRRTLEQVCASATIVSLNFDDKLSVATEAGYSLQAGNRAITSGETRATSSHAPRLTAELLDLIGHEIARATAATDGTLVLEFDSGTTLVLRDESPQYESYSITYRDETWYV